MSPHQKVIRTETGLTIRRLEPADLPQVQWLIDHGVMAGHIPYEARGPDRIDQALRTNRERFFVAEFDDQIVGTIALIEANPDVGHLHWLRVAPDWQRDLTVAELLVRAAAEHAQDVGILKLAMHAPADAEQTVKDYYQKLGFGFSRTRSIGDLRVLEFYLNLYQPPEID